jgi:hypothetical protein
MSTARRSRASEARNKRCSRRSPISMCKRATSLVPA